MNCWLSRRIPGRCCSEDFPMGMRRATPSDLKAVLRIGEGSFVGDDPFDADWLVDEISLKGRFLIVDDAGGGLIRGFMLTEKSMSGTTVRLIAVDPQFRKQGVGRRLLSRVKGPAGASVREENTASRALFTRMGWEETVSDWVEAKQPEAHSGRWVHYCLPRIKEAVS